MYVLYNMHWEPHVFGLPHLPKGQTWHVLYDTSKGPEKGVYGETAALELKDQSQIAMMPRSIVVLCGQPGNGAPEAEGSRELPVRLPFSLKKPGGSGRDPFREPMELPERKNGRGTEKTALNSSQPVFQHPRPDMAYSG